MSGLLNDKGQSIFYGKTGGVVVTGNEDGIKHVAMNVLYSLSHLGYVIPPQADCGWIGEAVLAAIKKRRILGFGRAGPAQGPALC